MSEALLYTVSNKSDIVEIELVEQNQVKDITSHLKKSMDTCSEVKTDLLW